LEEHHRIFFAKVIAGISYIFSHDNITGTFYVQNALPAVDFITLF